MINLSHVTTLALACTLFASPIFAQSAAAEDYDDDDVGWSYSISAGMEYEPAYTGSDVYSSEPGLNFEAAYTTQSGHEFFLSLGEFGARWEMGVATRLSTVLEYEFGRENADDPVLNGFPEVEATVEAQTVLQQNVGPVILGIGTQYDVLNRGKGLVGFLGVAYRRKLTPALQLQTQVDVSFANAEHMQTEVGIDAATAAATGYSAYAPDAGYKGVTAQVALEYTFANQWGLMSVVSVERYGTIMKDSPLISEFGTDTNVELEFGVGYHF